MAYSGKIYAARKRREKHYRLDGAEWALLRALGDPATGLAQVGGMASVVCRHDCRLAPERAKDAILALAQLWATRQGRAEHNPEGSSVPEEQPKRSVWTDGKGGM